MKIESGKIKNLLDFFKIENKKILLITSKNIFKKRDIKTFIKNLKKKNIVEISNFIRAGAYLQDLNKLYKFSLPNLIIAIGGGSVIDISKALSCTFYEKKIHDRFENKVKLLVIPTLSGTGSECSKGAILQYKNGTKFALRSKKLIPNFIFYDFKLCLSAPKKLRAEALFDCLSHAIETYISKKTNLLNKARSIYVIKKILKLNIRSIDSIKNQKIITKCSYLMGKNLVAGTTCLPHRIQYSLSMYSNSTHAQGIIALYKGWLLLINHSKSFKFLEKKVSHRGKKLIDTINNFKIRMKINYNLKTLKVNLGAINNISLKTKGTLNNDPIYKNIETIKNILHSSL